MSGPATPHVLAAANASFTVPGSAPPAATAATAPPLPNPHMFDVLPDLHKMLTRLINTSAQPLAPTPTPSQPLGDGPLDIKDLGKEASHLKIKMQKARKAVMALPDIDRTCEDQEEEIEDLEARKARLKNALRGLGESPSANHEEDADMSGSTDCIESLFLALANAPS